MRTHSPRPVHTAVASLTLALALSACDSTIPPQSVAPPPAAAGGEPAASTGGASGTGGTTDTSSGGTTGTGGTTDTSSGGTTGTGGTTSTGGAAGSGGTVADSGVPPSDPPVAPSPCGSDVMVHNGTVRPDFGVVPDGGPFLTDPAANGTGTWATVPLTIPLVAETFQGAGLTIDLTAGQLSGTAWVPDGTAKNPLVVILPGFQTSYATYTPYAEHLASHGFLVVGVDTRSNALVASHDKEALEVVRTIDFALGKSPFATKIDATKIAVAGHSKGGKVAFFAAALDPRVDLVVGWDPVNAGGGPCGLDPNCDALPVAPNCRAKKPGIEQYMHAESLIIGAPPDALLNPDPNFNADNFYRGAPSPTTMITLNTGHISWAQGAAPVDAFVFPMTKQAHTALLLARFKGRTGLEKYLPPVQTFGGDPHVKTAVAK
jgi:pimeloyl-ACP methyl ester carboxylesterase